MKKSAEHITSFELDINNPPPLADEQQAELETLSIRPENAINYSDIPPVEDFSRYYRPYQEDDGYLS